jgi:PAS domain-containing protein
MLCLLWVFLRNYYDRHMFSLIALSSIIIILISFGYVVILYSSNKRIVTEQQLRIEEIEQSEQRYKALFDNSVAGIMNFDFSTGEVFEANQTLLDMFNIEDENNSRNPNVSSCWCWQQRK